MADEIVVLVNRLIAIRDAVKDLQESSTGVIPVAVYDAVKEIEDLLFEPVPPVVAKVKK